MRNIHFERNFVLHPDGSCLASFGDTRVLCTATIENDQPPFLREGSKGWITAEYAMLPGSTGGGRKRREIGKRDGRSTEIQRLIGRSLRTAVDLEKLGPVSIILDCDVIQADGGTRTASITGGFIALSLALLKLKKNGLIESNVIKDYVAAISVGIFEDEMLLDLNYQEDSNAEMDMNVVMLGRGRFVEVQGTAEGKPFSKKQMDRLLELAKKGIEELIEIQKKNLKELKLV